MRDKWNIKRERDNEEQKEKEIKLGWVPHHIDEQSQASGVSDKLQKETEKKSKRYLKVDKTKN